MKPVHEDTIRKVKQQINAGLDVQEIANQAGISVELVRSISGNRRHQTIDPQIDKEIRSICKRGYWVEPPKIPRLKTVKEPEQCSTEGCTNPEKARGMCVGHYHSYRNPIREYIRPSIETVEEYLLRIKVVVKKPTGIFYADIDQECWLYPHINKHHRYGVICYKNKKQGVHQWAYEIWNGEIGSMYVLHKCDVTTCFNPEHLYLGTQQDNMNDRSRRARY